ncbi:porin [Methylobacterium sp. Leaf104]|uniref:outer membrane protein n=1 Tax=Methylobacterium TaxID=407 RepID=UPI0006F2467C|nr:MULTISPECIES: outer membrane beta-barrel protein [Methylobacterium]KQP33931.1 porin [Methylobacterium sp. Leaf104]MCI9879480.1 porin family protein [Methylobacterium goesingense]
MRRTKLTSLARSITLIASVAAPCLAQAADLLPPLPPEPLPPPVEIGGGWYLRGDVGAGAVEVNKIVTRRQDGYLPPTYQIEQKAVSGSFFAGGGVGYQFNAFLRGDITGEYRGGSRLNFSDSTLETPTYKYLDYYNANLASVVVMANGYIDLGTWYGVTPYIGGGVGSAFHHVSGFNDIGPAGSGIAREKYSSTFAWSAQAGLAYSVTPNLKLELGYRYSNLGSVKLGAINCFNNGCDLPYSYTAKDITSHDVKVGMRWLLGGAAPLVASYAPEPGPLVRKY